MSDGGPQSQSSCPGLIRASTRAGDKNVDGRDKPGHDGVGGGRRGLRFVAIVVAAVCIVSVAVAAWAIALGPLPLSQAERVSTTIVDRNGKLLRAYAMADGRWRLPVDVKKDIDPTYLKLLLAYEDQRFYSHGGVDPWAWGRAAVISCPAVRPSRCNWRG
jgi:penicillin-binding protein 1C